jgi:hypothetical protein
MSPPKAKSKRKALGSSIYRPNTANIPRKQADIHDFGNTIDEAFLSLTRR